MSAALAAGSKGCESMSARRASPARRCPLAGSIDYRAVDAVALFRDWGLYLGPTRRDGQHAVICPWGAEHTGGRQGAGDTVIWEAAHARSGWATFHCAHAHCHGRRMVDVFALVSETALLAACRGGGNG